uniref:Uncharacterized protein n=1 Tax=Nothoprocta perdicaria TaxID=30464 RepID=A0A8C6ZKA9_NOTPE
EARAQQAPLPQVQGLLYTCGRKAQQDAHSVTVQEWSAPSACREMKSLWNCGSMTCIMYLIWEGSQRSMSSSRASSFSGPHDACTHGRPSQPPLPLRGARAPQAPAETTTSPPGG